MFFKQLTFPVVFSSLLSVLFVVFTRLVPELNLVLSFFIKAMLFGIIWVSYVHFSKLFDVVGMFRKLFLRF